MGEALITRRGGALTKQGYIHMRDTASGSFNTDISSAEIAEFLYVFEWYEGGSKMLLLDTADLAFVIPDLTTGKWIDVTTYSYQHKRDITVQILAEWIDESLYVYARAASEEDVGLIINYELHIYFYE